MKRWDEDGDLFKSAVRKAKKHWKGDITFCPQIVHTGNPTSPTMMAIVVLATAEGFKMD